MTDKAWVKARGGGSATIDPTELAMEGRMPRCCQSWLRNARCMERDAFARKQKGQPPARGFSRCQGTSRYSVHRQSQFQAWWRRPCRWPTSGSCDVSSCRVLNINDFIRRPVPCAVLFACLLDGEVKCPLLRHNLGCRHAGRSPTSHGSETEARPAVVLTD